KSSENRRRRPVPVITSSRRTAVVSGLSIWSSVGTSRSPIQRPNNRPSPTSNEGGITTALTMHRLARAKIHQRCWQEGPRTGGLFVWHQACVGLSGAVSELAGRERRLL